MIGVNASMPNAPRLVIVNVPPCISSGRSRRSRARSIRSRDRAAISPQPEPRRVADHRDEQARLGVDGDPDVRLVGDDRSGRSSQRAFSSGCSRSASGGQLDDEVGVAGHARRPAPAALNWRAEVHEVRRVDRGRAASRGPSPAGSRPSARRSSGGSAPIGIDRPATAGASVGRDPRPAAARTSTLRIRPVRPLPRSRVQSTPSSRASRRASGEIRGRSPTAAAIGRERPRDRRRPPATAASSAGVLDRRARVDDRRGFARLRAGSRSPSPTATTSPASGAVGGMRRMPASSASTSWVAFSPSRVNSGSPGADGLAVALEPADEDAFVHVPAEPGDGDRDGHDGGLTPGSGRGSPGRSPPTFGTTAASSGGL